MILFIDYLISWFAIFCNLRYHTVIWELYNHKSVKWQEWQDKKDKNIEMAETESFCDMEKPKAEDTLKEDNSEMTIQQLYQDFYI